MDFINQEFTFTLSGLALTGVAVFGVISFIAILFYLSHLLGRIRTLEKPKYGFLGKSLYGFLAMMVMIAGLGFFSYSFTTQEDFTIEAKKTVTAEIKTSVISEDAAEAVVEFKAIPYVEGAKWGDKFSEFEIYWNIRGTESFDKFEFDRSTGNPSGFSEKIAKGIYEIKVVIVFEGKSYTFEESFRI